MLAGCRYFADIHENVSALPDRGKHSVQASHIRVINHYGIVWWTDSYLDILDTFGQPDRSFYIAQAAHASGMCDLKCSPPECLAFRGFLFGFLRAAFRRVGKRR